MWNRLRRWWTPDLAIDLGTASTRMAVAGRGVTLDEPSVIVLNKGTRQVLGQGTAVGKLARQMIGRTPDSITAVRPVRDGVITDFELCETMLRYFMRKALRRDRGSGVHPRVVLSVPGHVTEVERRAVFNSAERAGAGQVYLVRHAVAAAIGAGIPLAEPLAGMVCDIGGGTTDAAVFSLSETVSSLSIRVAGDALDQAIADHLRHRLGLRVGERSAEELKLEIGSAAPLDVELTAEVKGRDAVSGVPRKVLVTSQEVREAMAHPLRRIANELRRTIEDCHPELVADLVDNGLVLTGGGALLRNLDVWLAEQLNMPVRVAEDPRSAVIRGASICVEHLADWRELLDAGI
jgi:rod shape-determining protein MreB